MYVKLHPGIALYTQELVWTVCGFVGVWVGGYTVLVAVLEIYASAGANKRCSPITYFRKSFYISDPATFNRTSLYSRTHCT